MFLLRDSITVGYAKVFAAQGQLGGCLKMNSSTTRAFLRCVADRRMAETSLSME